MVRIVQRDKANTAYDEVGPENPLAVEVYEPVTVTSGLYRTDRMQIPGIATGAAYAAADAFGSKGTITVPDEGTIATLVFLDYDDEGLTKELVLFDADFTPTADNSAFAVSDADLAKCIGVITVDTFNDFANNQVGIATPALAYKVSGQRLYYQWVTRGADNIAASAIPQFFLSIV